MCTYYVTAPKGDTHLPASPALLTPLAFAKKKYLFKQSALNHGISGISPFSWLIGASIAGLLYLIIAKRQPYYEDVSGESIAVDNVNH
ncbi:hypothetical protein [Pseudomonas sp. CFII68]|uniref:hypothetical protein n=1 Tax=Pseudomonas sp. CFII68 TaxID=911243 RepID=UPI0004130D41|nr:hypothetical protein [Pseudomonas sp. CFII68]